MLTAALISLISGTGPKIIDEARKLVERFTDGAQTSETVSGTDDQESPSVLRERIDNLQERVDALESSAFDQAKLATRMAEQGQALETGQQALATGLIGLAKRVKLQLLGTVIALDISIIAIVIGLI